MVPVLFSGGALTLFPNPTDGTTLWLSIDAADAEPMHMEIMDGLGRTVRSETIALSAGRQVVYLLGGGTLAAGTYTARLFRGGTPIALPVVVQ
ncbi:MAG: T9SS type A sorting domain-containing protein [Flavobacteriales bacterium]|nr:T9SS type A sorting domain-containing protein [Flavobacteriales bacterium]